MVAFTLMWAIVAAAFFSARAAFFWEGLIGEAALASSGRSVEFAQALLLACAQV